MFFSLFVYSINFNTEHAGVKCEYAHRDSPDCPGLRGPVTTRPGYSMPNPTAAVADVERRRSTPLRPVAGLGVLPTPDSGVEVRRDDRKVTCDPKGPLRHETCAPRNKKQRTSLRRVGNKELNE